MTAAEFQSGMEWRDHLYEKARLAIEATPGGDVRAQRLRELASYIEAATGPALMMLTAVVLTHVERADL